MTHCLILPHELNFSLLALTKLMNGLNESKRLERNNTSGVSRNSAW
jgi:hypothetical protein